MKLGDIICYIDWDIDFRVVTKEQSEIYGYCVELYSGWVYDYCGAYNEKNITFITGGEDERGPYIVVEVE